MANTVRDSRLIVPQLPPRHVSRPRLLAELDNAANSPLTLLSAGPGRARPCCSPTGSGAAAPGWPGSTRRPRTPTRRGSGACSCRPSGSATARSAARRSRCRGGLAVDLVQTLFSAVPESAAQLVVIIDDAHVLTHAEVLQGLDSLIRAGQPGLRLMLAARSDPLLPLHRYRLAGQMRELRAADLAMTPAEIREVLAVHGVSLGERDFGILAARTEGWATGVRLSAMRMEGTEYPEDFVSELALDPGSIGEYLVDEVLRQQPEAQRTAADRDELP